MSTLRIDLPETLLLATGQTSEEFVREARLLLALDLFRLGRISSGKAAELCGWSRLDFLFEASRRGVALSDVDGLESWQAADAR